MTYSPADLSRHRGAVMTAALVRRRRTSNPGKPTGPSSTPRRPLPRPLRRLGSHAWPAGAQAVAETRVAVAVR